METFIKRQVKQDAGFNIGVILNKKAISGDIGLEIEVEGSRLPKQDFHPDSKTTLPKVWGYHHDGSLRGEDNAEYVLKKPIPFGKVDEALTDLWAVFRNCDSRLDESNRTSVHVHLNCQSFHMNRLTSFIALYVCFEELLTEWCGEHRVGNLFCLRAKDAPASISMIRRFIRSDGRAGLPEILHYAGLNVHALAKFGSLEVRSLRGTPDKETILQWVTILRRLYEVSAGYADPRDICGDFSRLGPSEFYETILGDVGQVIRQGIEYREEQIRDSLYEGIRLAQGLCYCRDWDLFNKVDLQPDPFGRDARKIAKKLNGGEGPDVQVMYDELAEGGTGSQIGLTMHQQSANQLFTLSTWQWGNPPAPPPPPTSDILSEFEEEAFDPED